MKQITFGEHRSYNDLFLICKNKTIGSPEVKKHIVDVEGGDGVLDYTEYFGETKYGNRQLEFEFATHVQPYAEYYSQVQNLLHGKRMRIVLDDDPEYYYVGRLEVSEFSREKNIGAIMISCDCEPYKYKKNQTVVSRAVSRSATITLDNLRKRVVPEITTSAEMTIEFGGKSITHSAGTFTIPTLELAAGSNTVKVTGTGNIIFKYQEGGL